MSSKVSTENYVKAKLVALIYYLRSNYVSYILIRSHPLLNPIDMYRFLTQQKSQNKTMKLNATIFRMCFIDFECVNRHLGQRLQTQCKLNINMFVVVVFKKFYIYPYLK